jgi:hypothetical protein
MDRREFLRDWGRKTVAATAAVATPALALKDDVLKDLSEVVSSLDGKINKVSSTLGGKIDGLSDRLDASAVALAYQQYQLHLIFLLLLISFAIDGGMAIGTFVLN